MEFLEKAKGVHDRHRGLIAAAFFVGGFLFDILTLGSIDDPTNIVLQIVYLTLSFLIIFKLKDHSGETYPKIVEKILEYKEDIFHFLIGSLLSSFTIFYFNSSSALNSSIFLLVIVAVLILNEVNYFQKLGITFKSVLLVISSTSFFIYFIPLVLRTNHRLTFYLSILISFLLIKWVSKVIKRSPATDPLEIKREFEKPGFITLAFFLLFYFTNILPPLPLSLNQLGVYYGVEKKYPEYHLKTQKKWWKFWHSSNEDFYYREGDRVYVFFKVFSPGDFKEKVVVEWGWYDEQSSEWKESDSIPVQIVGGREEGFRGVLYKENYKSGEWRVFIKTENDLVLGQLHFELIKDDNDQNRNFRIVVDK